MDFLEVSKLVLFILFFVPGFITIKTYNLISPSSKSTSEEIVDAISYSSINYAVWLIPLIYLYEFRLHDNYLLISSTTLFFIVFISPVALAFLWKKLRSFDFFQMFAPHPTGKPWDYYFSKKKTCGVIINMGSGKKVGGIYGVNAFSSSYPHEEQIYLDEEWIINEDGAFERPVAQSAGIIVFLKDAESLEFYHSGENTDE